MAGPNAGAQPGSQSGPQSPPPKDDRAIYVAIVDGTGESNDKSYAEQMEKSFCHTLYKALVGRGSDKVHYERGPSLSGQQERAEANSIFSWVKTKHDADSNGRIILVGYSRGGSAVIGAAQDLQSNKIQVDSLFLFDPVARHFFDNGHTLPDNVDCIRVARRNIDPSFTDKYESKLSISKTFGDSGNPCRPFFGQTAIVRPKKGDFQEQVFTVSHGGAGGVGWKFVVEDGQNQAKVGQWMVAQMAARGLQVSLGNGSLNPQKAEDPSPRVKTANTLLSHAEHAGTKVKNWGLHKATGR